jgi:CubicO group peptidase (beta-lactamase class C family)
LATHVSGLPNLVDNDTGQPVTGVGIACADEQAWDAVWHRVQTMPIEFDPGQQTSYNQTNYALLGKVINKISGKPFTQFIKERQLDPVGMSGTRYGDDSAIVPHRARSYSNLDSGNGAPADERATLTAQYVRFAPFLLTAAGLNSSAHDLARWIIALQEGQLLNKFSLTTLWTPSILSGGKAGTWGLGWPIVARKKHMSYMPQGGAKAAIAVYPEDDLAIVILTNLQGSMPERFIDRVAAYYIPDFPPA